MASVTTSFTTFGTSARAGSWGGTEDWDTPGNAQANDGSRTGYDNLFPHPWADGYSFYLTAKNMTDDVSAGSTIDGIEIHIERREDASSGTGEWHDSAVYIIQGGSIITTENKAVATAYTTTDTSVTYGSPTDLWGISWTDSDVPSDGFGVAISCAKVDAQFAFDSKAEIDSITVTVYYTEASGGGSSSRTSRYRKTLGSRAKRGIK